MSVFFKKFLRKNQRMKSSLEYSDIKESIDSRIDSINSTLNQRMDRLETMTEEKYIIFRIKLPKVSIKGATEEFGLPAHGSVIFSLCGHEAMIDLTKDRGFSDTVNFLAFSVVKQIIKAATKPAPLPPDFGEYFLEKTNYKKLKNDNNSEYNSQVDTFARFLLGWYLDDSEQVRFFEKVNKLFEQSEFNFRIKA